MFEPQLDAGIQYFRRQKTLKSIQTESDPLSHHNGICPPKKKKNLHSFHAALTSARLPIGLKMGRVSRLSLPGITASKTRPSKGEVELSTELSTAVVARSTSPPASTNRKPGPGEQAIQ